jgi:hypothetical protein
VNAAATRPPLPAGAVRASTREPLARPQHRVRETAARVTDGDDFREAGRRGAGNQRSLRRDGGRQGERECECALHDPFSLHDTEIRVAADNVIVAPEMTPAWNVVHTPGNVGSGNAIGGRSRRRNHREAVEEPGEGSVDHDHHVRERDGGSDVERPIPASTRLFLFSGPAKRT